MTQDIQPNCMLCGHTMHEELCGLTDNRFGSGGEYCIVKCLNCELLQTIPPPNPEQLKELYETYYNFGGENGTIYSSVIDIFFSSIAYRTWMAIDGDISFYSRRDRGHLLDIGCNEGRGLLIYKRNGFDPEGLELNERAAQNARMAGFSVHTQTLDEFQPKQPFDVVVLSNVIEHASNPKNMLEHVRRVLKPDGHVWISCPNNRSWLRRIFGRSWINWHVPFHFYHFSSKTLSQLLEYSGFEIKYLKFVTPSHWLSQSILARIFAKPGQQTRQLRNPLLVAFLMILCQLFSPLLWLGNLTGRGDCLVVEAVSKSKPETMID